MKKLLVLPLLMSVGLVSQAWAVVCNLDKQVTFCEYKGDGGSDPGGCYKNDDQYSSVGGVCEAGKCTCEQIIEGCKKNGKLFVEVKDEALNEGNQWGKGVKCGNVGGKEKVAEKPAKK